ncbi:hypothetical protein BKA56DRAFT_666639 [Ilyonectria sp. MPI-CAGE-AT-0026]|nr:hypothetical protein BKA56DRAFT_666639 [Ilyonectria sp. MPI-CAGE-AT-0026]
MPHDPSPACRPPGGVSRRREKEGDREIRLVRTVLGDILPPDQDLTSICKERGINLCTLRVNPHDSKTIATVQRHGAKRIFELFSVRRGMLTTMMMPNGTETCMGDGITPLEITTVELQPTESNRGILAAHIGKLQDKLLSPADVRELVPVEPFFPLVVPGVG